MITGSSLKTIPETVWYSQKPMWRQGFWVSGQKNHEEIIGNYATTPGKRIVEMYKIEKDLNPLNNPTNAELKSMFEGSQELT